MLSPNYTETNRWMQVSNNGTYQTGTLIDLCQDSCILVSQSPRTTCEQMTLNGRNLNALNLQQPELEPILLIPLIVCKELHMCSRINWSSLEIKCKSMTSRVLAPWKRSSLTIRLGTLWKSPTSRVQEPGRDMRRGLAKVHRHRYLTTWTTKMWLTLTSEPPASLIHFNLPM